MKKRFIEWDLPLAEISEASKAERYKEGHPSNIHIWWARKPLASCRSTIFASLIDLPDSEEKRKDIYKLIKNLTEWDVVVNSNNKNLKKARKMLENQYGVSSPRVLDPFAGGGSIPLEALRLGAETYSNDYNPVAAYIQKATLCWPSKYGKKILHPDKKPGIDGGIQHINCLSYLVEKWAKIILNDVIKKTDGIYPMDADGLIPISYLWARTIPCQNPDCNIDIPLLGQFWLAKNDRKKIALIYQKKSDSFKITNVPLDWTCRGRGCGCKYCEGTISGGNVKCPKCDQSFSTDNIRKYALDGKLRERMVAVVRISPNQSGKYYREVTKEDEYIYNKTKEMLKDLIEKWDYLDEPFPNELIRTPNMNEVKSTSSPFFVHLQPVLYGMARYKDLMNYRQKVVIITFIETIKETQMKILTDCHKMSTYLPDVIPEELANAIIGFMGISLNKTIMKYNNLSRWNPNGEKTEYPISNNSISMLWNYSEINPLSETAGSWKSYLTYTIKAIDIIDINNANISITNNSVISLPYPNNYFDAILTDPPYYDNVPYGDLSDFFYVWLKRSVGDIFPEFFSTPLTPKSEEIIENESLLRRTLNLKKEDYERFALKDKVDFEKLLTKSFYEIYRILKSNGIATIIYAHKTTEGWETMLSSLITSGFVVTASWPIHTERSGRQRSIGAAALGSSIYMVCRKTERKKVGFYSELQPKIKDRIETKLQQFWNEGIAGGDFFISAIGPGMEIFSQYEKVEKLDGKQVTTAELLNYIRSVSTDFIVGKLLKGASSSNIDSESEFYLAYRWTYLNNTVEYDNARKLAIASDVNLEELWGPGGFVKKSGSKISVLGPKERGEFGDPRNMVDVMHKVLLLWEKGKKDEIAKLLARTGFQDDPAFKQFCQAIAECLLNGNKEKQLLEGFLIGIDNYAKVKVKIPKSQTDLKQFGGRLK